MSKKISKLENEILNIEKKLKDKKEELEKVREYFIINSYENIRKEFESNSDFKNNFIQAILLLSEKERKFFDFIIN